MMTANNLIRRALRYAKNTLLTPRRVRETLERVARLEAEMERLGHVDRTKMERLVPLLEHVGRQADSLNHLARSRADVRGHKMYLDPTDSVVSHQLLSNGVFEPEETALIEREVCLGDVVVDIGANIGYYTLILARLVGNSGRVFAFEPDPVNFELLQRNIWANGYRNVVPVQKAVLDRGGPLSLYLCGDNKGDHRVYSSDDSRVRIEIEGTSLDEYFGEREISVDFIKMDIQGAEGGALRGMQKLLARSPRAKVLTEFWPSGMRCFGSEPAEVFRSLAAGGFEIYRLGGAIIGFGEPKGVKATCEDEVLSLCAQDPLNYVNLYCTRAPLAFIPSKLAAEESLSGVRKSA